MLTEASDLPSSGQTDSAIIPSYLLANLVPCSFHLFIAWIYRETAVLLINGDIRGGEPCGTLATEDTKTPQKLMSYSSLSALGRKIFARIINPF
jgi:hypothetical protein